MNLIVITQPPAEPVTFAEVAVHLRLTLSADVPPEHPHQAMLERHIASARGDAEQITKRSLTEQTLRIFGTSFPDRIELLRPPVMSVLSVQYYDSDNALQTIAAENYYVTDDFVPRLRFAPAFSAPAVYDRPDAVRIDYVTGYQPEGSPPEDYAANIPEQIKQAIIIGVQLLYDPLEPKDREALERARDSLLSGFVVHTIA